VINENVTTQMKWFSVCATLSNTGGRAKLEEVLSMKRATLAFALTVGAASAVLAADMPAPAPIPPPAHVPVPPIYNWTGLYVGGNLGFGWDSGSFSDPLGNTLPLVPNGMFLGGGQVGVNYQFWDRVVICAEVDFDWLSNSSTTSSTGLFVNPPGVLTGSTATVTVNNRWLTTVTGRLGYAWDRLLLYAKGGGAWVGSNSPTFTVDGAPVTISTSNSNWTWTAGLGAEWAFWGNWSARLEYDFVGLSSQSFCNSNGTGWPPCERSIQWQQPKHSDDKCRPQLQIWRLVVISDNGPGQARVPHASTWMCTALRIKGGVSGTRGWP
jgi:outer membrane immunogenic protein